MKHFLVGVAGANGTEPGESGVRGAAGRDAAGVSRAAAGTAAERERFLALWEARQAVAEGAHERLVQLKALILCSLPYFATRERSITRRARLGRRSCVSVTFTSVDTGVPLPYGSDRALLGWITTQALQREGFVSFRTLTEFFGAFGLAASGREYQRFRERLERLKSLSITIVEIDGDAETRVVMHPIKRSFSPRAGRDVEQLAAGRLVAGYGIDLDPDFWRYLCRNHVPLPLPLMRLFHGNPQAWDFAQFCLYRSWAARSAAVVPWAELIGQMASKDRSQSRLKQRLAKVLRQIGVVYPGFPVRFLSGFAGLRVEPWRPK
jgi:hypothetical protein